MTPAEKVEQLRAQISALLGHHDENLANGHHREARQHLDEAMARCCDVVAVDPGAIEQEVLLDLLGRWGNFPVPLPGEHLDGAKRALELVGGRLPQPDRANQCHLLALAMTLRGEASTAELLEASQAFVEAARGYGLPEAYALAYLASHLEWLGEWGAARDRALEAAAVLEDADDLPMADRLDARRFIQQTLAHVLHRQGSFEAAAAAYLRVAPDYDDPEDRAAIRATAVTSLIAAGQLAEARAILDPVLNDMGALRYQDTAISVIEGELLVAEGRHEEAMAALTAARAALRSRYNPDIEWQLGRAMATSLRSLGHHREALVELEHGVEHALLTRRASLGYSLDSSSLEEKRPFFNEAVELAAELNEAAVCLRLGEAIKSRWLTAILSLPTARMEPGARRQLTELAQRVDNIERAIGMADPEVIGELLRRRDELWQNRQALLDRQRRTDPRWAALTEGRPMDVDRLVQELTRRDQAALGMFVTDQSIVSVVADRDGCCVGTMPRTETVERALNSYTENLVARRPVSGLFDPARAGVDAGALVAPELLQRALRSASIVVAPHGQLHMLPWPALLFDGARLVSQRPVGMLPNLSCLLLLGRPAAPPRGATLVSGEDVGDGLPGVRAEIDDLQSLYGSAAAGAAADQSTLLRCIAAAEEAILHVASHARADPTWPMASGLLCTDGYVDAADIVTSGVRRGEVVLSACSTGWRPDRVGSMVLHGDDVLGLPGAFMEGGADSIVMSIPPVEDGAMRRMMVDFHRERVAGRLPLEALAVAQRRRLAVGDPAWGWCGTVVYGVW